MGRKKLVEEKKEDLKPIRRAEDQESWENQLVALSMNLVEKRLREGTASAQEVCHFLKLGTQERRLEREKLENENKLLKAKTEALEASKDSSAMYLEAIQAFRIYSGQGNNNGETGV